MSDVDWAGPLFYPPVGMVAVTASGNRIAIWADEGDDPECFTGQLLDPASNAARVAVHDTSVFWARAFIARIETPTDEDRSLSVVDLAPTPSLPLLHGRG